MEYTRAYRLTQSQEPIQVSIASNPKIELDLTQFESLNSLVCLESDLPELYDRLVQALLNQEIGAATLTRVKVLEPSISLIERWQEQAKGDPAEVAKARAEWTAQVTAILTEFGKLSWQREEGRIKIEFNLNINELGKATLEFWSDLPTKGDLPITGIYIESTGDESTAQLTWTDRSGRVSQLSIVPGVIYPIRPVSVKIKGAPTIVLLA